MKVLVTRPEPDAAEFAHLLSQCGIIPVMAPVMDIQFYPEKKIDLSSITHLAFTSANGVRSISTQKKIRDLPAFAVGPASATIAEAAGFTVAGIAEGDVESLAALIEKKTGPRDVILHLAGTHRAGDLSELLAGLGRTCRREISYEAKKIPALPCTVIAELRDGTIDAVTFFSPRTARLFLDLIAAHKLGASLQGILPVCLSVNIAEILASSGMANPLISVTRDQQGMIDILQSART